jgi:hypothetical protein
MDRIRLLVNSEAVNSPRQLARELVISTTMLSKLAPFAATSPSTQASPPVGASTSPATTPADGESPELAAHQFLDAFMSGDGDRAVALVEADDKGIALIRSGASATRALAKLRQAAAKEFGDAGERMVEKSISLNSWDKVRGPATINGTTATIRAGNRDLRFVLVAEKWKIVFESLEPTRTADGKLISLEGRAKSVDELAYECYRLEDLLDSGQIRTLGQLQSQIQHSALAVAAFSGWAWPATSPSTNVVVPN